MAPRYVAILLNDVELAEYAYRASGDPQQRQAQLAQLRGSLSALANETCNLWGANERAVTAQDASSTSPPVTEGRPSRLRRLLRRAVYIVGGAVLVGVDAVG